MRRGILRRLEVLEAVAPDSGCLASYLAFDEEGNLVFPRGRIPLACLRELNELVNDESDVSEPEDTEEAQAE